MIKKVYWSSCRVTLILVRFQSNFNFADRFSKNIQMSKAMKIRPVGAGLFHAARERERETNITKLFTILRTRLKWKGGEKGKKEGCNYAFNTCFIFRCKAHWLFVTFTSSRFQNLQQYYIFDVAHPLAFTVKIKGQYTTVEGT